jgi:dynein heavy chain
MFTSPGVFGLHSNAEIQYYTSAAKELWLNIIELQTSDGGGGGGINREDLIT